MARCPKLEFDGEHTFYGDCKYICGLTGMEMSVDDPKVKHMCKLDYGYEYENCPIYKNS